MGKRRQKTYWIRDPRQLQVLVAPRCHDIVDRLSAHGALSIRELATHIGVKPSALYYHLEKLLEVGLVVEAGARVVRRKRERLYATPAPRMRLARALTDPALLPLMAAIGSSLTRQMDRDFRQGAGLPGRRPEGAHRNFGLFRLVGRPDPKQLKRINECLDEVAEILWHADDPAADALAFGWIMAPLPSQDPD